MEVKEKINSKMYTEADLIGKGGKFLVLTALERNFSRENFLKNKQ